MKEETSLTVQAVPDSVPPAPEQDQVKDMLAWLELRAAVLMKLDQREDASTVYR